LLYAKTDADAKTDTEIFSIANSDAEFTAFDNNGAGAKNKRRARRKSDIGRGQRREAHPKIAADEFQDPA
jgi:hypothetical protein